MFLTVLFLCVGPGLALVQVTVVAVAAGVLGTGEVVAAAEAHLARFLSVVAPPLPPALPSPPPLLYLINRESESCFSVQLLHIGITLF